MSSVCCVTPFTAAAESARTRAARQRPAVHLLARENLGWSRRRRRESEVGHYHDMREELRGSYDKLRERVPGVASGYAALHRGAMSEGELSRKTKELIALAVSVTLQCDGCVAAHARAAARHGATAQEIAETVGVCILMNGGPGTVYGSRALDAFEEFATSAGASGLR
jgi:AhpD family alkylhydroperoxidase